MEPLAYLAARIFSCGSWICAGVHAASHFEMTASGMAKKGIPLPRLALPFVLLIEFGGVALVVADTYTWAVCLVWIAFLIVATYFYHRRWVTPEGQFDFFECVQFWKNMSLIGGLMAMALLDPSRPDWLLRG